MVETLVHSAHVPRDQNGTALNPWLIAVTVAITTFMEVLDISIANVSLRHIAGDLSAGQDESTWVLTSYLVSNAIVLPISGWLSSLMGRRRFYMLCVALFTASSLLCGLAPNLALLIFFRALQGFGGGGLQPSSQAILADTFPPAKRGMAFAVYGITTVMAPAIGPTIGGWITDTFTWRWIFLINVPVGILSIYLTSRLVFDPPHFAQQRKELKSRGFKIDYFGFALLTLGFGCLQIVLDKGQQEDWFDSQFIVVMTAISVISLVVLPFWELRLRDPMVDVRLLLQRNFLVSNILIFMLGFILFGSTVLLPLFVQNLLGYSATDAGLVLSPGGLTVLLFMPLIGMMVNRVDVRHMITFGILANAVALFFMSRLDLQADYWSIATLRILQGIGLGFLFIPINTAAFAEMPMVKSSNASAIINLFRNLGGSFGISLVQTWLTQGSQKHQADLVAHVSTLSPQTTGLLGQLTQAIAARGSTLGDAVPKAQATLYAFVQQQSSLMAFLDNFRLLAFLFLAFIPAVYVLKRSRRHA
ncbi:MAG: DHA2 family efflux MFS transporter permease subunit [Betaproteobacteria bacterium]|nr:DHA2 family efflux MFS transporter permease subunit [Betaproteobacteria bacterium]MDE2622200.1 DHA2 family efflux MFS transporter permease subunit [Betaproteobacteria bacterium]